MTLPKTPQPRPARPLRASLIGLTLASLIACGPVQQYDSGNAEVDDESNPAARQAHPLAEIVTAPPPPAASAEKPVALPADAPAPETPVALPVEAPAPVPVGMSIGPEGELAQSARPSGAQELMRSAEAGRRNQAELLTGTAHFASGVIAQDLRMASEPLDRENYAQLAQHGIKVAANDPISTFSIDVDTGAYSNMRRFLNQGRLPPDGAVRVEELINYFSYQYTPPTGEDRPFSVRTEVAATPWNPETLLMQVGIKGYEVPAQERPASNLVFLLDVSGSMKSPDKLPLLKNAFRMLTQNLGGRDRVAMVVYAGASGVVLEPTAGDDNQRILSALDALSAGGSTNGGAGIALAYAKARESFIDGGINRVILATDGDFNVGVADFDALIDRVERERESGVSLTTLGFGTGNYNDKLMERLADAGNGNYAYIDGLSEARKVLVDELGSTLHTIAKDVKIQVEFNPARIAEYRLIGYENRALRTQDFNNDKIDAGEIGAGHTVTAIYELTPVDSKARLIEPRRYDQAPPAMHAKSTELAFVRLRYKAPDGDVSKLIEMAVKRDEIVQPNDTSDDFRFAAAVAAFGQQLKGGLFTGDYRLDETAALAGSALGPDTHGYRHEFVSLVNNAAALLPTAGVKVGQSDGVAN